MALPGAAQCGRNPAHGALAGDGPGGPDDCGGACPLDGAGARLRLFALAVLAADGVLRACGGGDVAGALPAAVDNRFSIGGACGGHRVAGADLDVRDRTARAIFSILRVRDGGGGLSLGAVGNGGHGGYGGGTARGGSLRGASWTGNGGGPVAASSASAPTGCKRAGTGSATTVHELGVSDCARIFAGLHGGEPEEGAGGARRDHARSQFDASGGGTDRDHAAGSWGSDEHLRRVPGAQRLAGEAQLPGLSCRDSARRRGRRSVALARSYAGKRKSVLVRLACGRDLRVAQCQGFSYGVAGSRRRAAARWKRGISGCAGASGKV